MSQDQAEGLRREMLAKERQKNKEEYERQKQKIILETERARPSNARFIGQNDSMEDTLKKTTVGLVRLEDFQQRRRELEEAKAREAAKTDDLKYALDLNYYGMCRVDGLLDVEMRLGKSRRRQKSVNVQQRRHCPSRWTTKREMEVPLRLPRPMAMKPTTMAKKRNSERIRMLIHRFFPTEKERNRKDANVKSFARNG